MRPRLLLRDVRWRTAYVDEVPNERALYSVNEIESNVIASSSLPSSYTASHCVRPSALDNRFGGRAVRGARRLNVPDRNAHHPHKWLSGHRHEPRLHAIGRNRSRTPDISSTTSIAPSTGPTCPSRRSTTRDLRLDGQARSTISVLCNARFETRTAEAATTQNKHLVDFNETAFVVENTNDPLVEPWRIPGAW